MDNTILESDLEHFLSKRALRLLGLFLSSKGRLLLNKKDLLQIRAIQSIFWKALRPTFNRIYIHTSRAGERLQTKFNHLFLRSTLALDNFNQIYRINHNNHTSNQFSAIKKIIKPFNVGNVHPILPSTYKTVLSSKSPKSLPYTDDLPVSRTQRLFSELLNRAGKLNCLRVILSEIETRIPVNSSYEYNRKRIENSNVKRLFWRQSKRTIHRLSKDLQKNKRFGAKTNHLVRSEACAVCSLDECVDEDDVFVYCDCCSILVHRKCLQLDQEQIQKSVWFCPNCQRSKDKKRCLDKIVKGLRNCNVHEIPCGRKKKDLKTITVEQVIKKLFEIPESACVFCGKEGSITLPIKGVPDHFGHVSCAKWLDKVHFTKNFDKIVFTDKGELIDLSLIHI